MKQPKKRILGEKNYAVLFFKMTGQVIRDCRSRGIQLTIGMGPLAHPQCLPRRILSFQQEIDNVLVGHKT